MTVLSRAVRIAKIECFFSFFQRFPLQGSKFYCFFVIKKKRWKNAKSSICAPDQHWFSQEKKSIFLLLLEITKSDFFFFTSFFFEFQWPTCNFEGSFLFSDDRARWRLKICHFSHFFGVYFFVPNTYDAFKRSLTFMSKNEQKKFIQKISFFWNLWSKCTGVSVCCGKVFCMLW